LPVIAAAFWFLVPHETLARIATIPEQLHRGDLNHRLNIWSAGWQAFRHAPFFGQGAGTFVQAAGLAPADTAHNTALAIAVEGGIIAVIFASAILAVCAISVLATRGSVRIALATAFLIWLVTSLVATVEESRTTWLLMGMMSFAARLATQQPALMDRWFSGEAPEPLYGAEEEMA
jgi:O-antigen ligase